MDNQLPNPDLIGDLVWGVFKPQWIRMAHPQKFGDVARRGTV